MSKKIYSDYSEMENDKWIKSTYKWYELKACDIVDLGEF